MKISSLRKKPNKTRVIPAIFNRESMDPRLRLSGMTVLLGAHKQKGLTLIEFLIVAIIGVIALIALAVPFMAERRFSGLGKSQVEAQRDAQLVTRAIARIARESSFFSFAGPAGDSTLSFTTPCGSVSFRGGSAFNNGGPNNGQLIRTDQCVVPNVTTVLIDGTRSKITNFTATTVIPQKIVDLQVNIQYQNQRSELLQTRIYLRNG